MRSKRLIDGKGLIHRLRIGLLVSGIASLFLVVTGTVPADAAVTGSGNDGFSLSVVSVQLVNKVAVNVNFSVTCTTAGDPNNNPEPYGAIISFTLLENVKGTIVSNSGQTGGGINPFAGVTCNGTPQTVTVTLIPSGPAYKPGPAYISNVGGGVWDQGFDCGSIIFNGNPAPLPCESLSGPSLSGGVQINGGAT